MTPAFQTTHADETMTIADAIRAKEALLRTFADAANAFVRKTGLQIDSVSFTAFGCAPDKRYVFDMEVRL